MFEVFIAMLMLNEQVPDLLAKSKLASLSTVYEGKPFGSLVAYAVDKSGTPILFISDLALHTKNLAKDGSCSFMVSQIDEDDPLNSKRITLIGKMKKVERSDDLKKAYFGKFPKNEGLLGLGDFNFYKMEIEKVYWVGGYGDIQWIELADYRSYFNK